jgi:hypothetical protein
MMEKCFGKKIKKYSFFVNVETKLTLGAAVFAKTQPR